MVAFLFVAAITEHLFSPKDSAVVSMDLVNSIQPVCYSLGKDDEPIDHCVHVHFVLHFSHNIIITDRKQHKTKVPTPTSVLLLSIIHCMKNILNFLYFTVIEYFL